MPLLDSARLRPLALLLSLLAAACAPRPGLPIEPDPIADGGADLGDTEALFTGIWTWDGANSSISTVCDNGGHSNGGPPEGPFSITSGPGARQVNIGVGTAACPVFLFDVAGEAATIAGPGTTCNSGPGTLTARSGSLTPTDADATMTLVLTLDAEEPGNNGLMHCVITVAGNATRGG